MKKFSEAFEEFATARCEEILKEDGNYWSMVKQISGIHKTLKLALPKEQLELLVDLENTTAKMHIYADILIYSHGVKDGIAIKNLTKNLTHRCFL